MMAVFSGSQFVGGNWQNGFGIQFIPQSDGRLIATYEFDALKQGPPGIVHGGALAAVFDEAMTVTTHFHQLMPAVTANLNVTYYHPVYLQTKVVIAAHLDRVDGRKIFLEAQVSLADDTVAASATALFIKLKPNP